MRKYFFIVLLVLGVFGLYGQLQQTQTWYFCCNTGIKFVDGNPVALSDGKINNLAGEGCSVISDNNGNLLFYTDGLTIWDKNHNVMPNGSGLSGHISATQVQIVKVPGSCQQYYIFYSTGPYTSTSADNKAYYSIVDLTLNGGLGDVIVSSKNTLLYNPATEKIASVVHQNGKDNWIILHELNSSNFLSYLISASGINTTPVISSIGLSHTNPIGYMKSNHKGDKLAAALPFNGTNRVELYDFNSSTGIISNPVIFSNWAGAYGLEFSPNDSLLYASCFWNTNYVYQINLLNNSYQAITSANAGNYNYNALQLGADGKIYMVRNDLNYLSVINYPNKIGAACNFIDIGFPLAAGTSGKLGLPSFEQSLFLSMNNNFTFNTQNCSSIYNFFISLNNNYDSLLWNFGDINSGSNNYSDFPNPQHTFSGNGNYTVTLIVYYPCYNDTIQHVINVVSQEIEVNLGNDTSICTGNQIILNAGSGFSSYKWNTGATTSSLSVITSGIYSVTVTDIAGCTGADSIIIIISNSPVVNLGNDTSICTGNQIIINAGSGFSSYKWNTGATTSSLSVITSGIYSVTVTDIAGCTGADSIIIIISNNLIVNLGNDTSICTGNLITFTPGTGYVSYFWNTGETSSSITVSNNGTYSVTVTDTKGCKGTASVNLMVNPPLSISLNTPDDTLCPDECTDIMINVSGGNGGPYKLTLQDNSAVISPFKVCPSVTTTYTVTAGDNCTKPSVSDDITVYVFPKPPVLFDTDKKEGCAPLEVHFKETSANEEQLYHWSFEDQYGNNISTDKNPIYIYNYPGTYNVSCTVTSVAECKNTLTINKIITIYPNPVASFIAHPQVVTLFEPEICFENTSSTLYYSLWRFGDGDSSEVTHPSHRYSKSGIYRIVLYIESEHGCSDTTLLDITVQDINTFYAPNAFTPDVDGINTLFSPICTGIDKTYWYLAIFDRWGEKVFETNIYDVNENGKVLYGWDGRIKGKAIGESALYVWLCIYRDIKGIEYSKCGIVNLIR